jgi:ribonuclease VapC
VSCVLDASALLALLQGEAGAEQVEVVIDESALSTVNWSEVCQRSLARGIGTEGLRTDVEALGLRIEPFVAEDAEAAAALWPAGRRVELSLGDRACLPERRRRPARHPRSRRARAGSRR